MKVPAKLAAELAKIPFTDFWSKSYGRLRKSRELTKANLRREIFDFILGYPGIDVHYLSDNDHHPAIYALFYFESNIGDIPVAYVTNPGMQMVALFDNGTKIKNNKPDIPIVPSPSMHIVKDKSGNLVLTCA